MGFPPNLVGWSDLRFKTDHMITRAHSISRVRNEEKDKLGRYCAPHTVPGT